MFRYIHESRGAGPTGRTSRPHWVAPRFPPCGSPKVEANLLMHSSIELRKEHEEREEREELEGRFGRAMFGTSWIDEIGLLRNICNPKEPSRRQLESGRWQSAHTLIS